MQDKIIIQCYFVYLRITAVSVPYPSDIWYKCRKLIEKCEGKFELNFVNVFIYH